MLIHRDLYNVISHIPELITSKEGRPARTSLCSPERPAAAHSPLPPHTTHTVHQPASHRCTTAQRGQTTVSRHPSRMGSLSHIATLNLWPFIEQLSQQLSMCRY